MTASPLVRSVLALSYQEREDLLAALIESLEDDVANPVTGEEEWNKEWAEVVGKRLRELDEGKVETIPAARVLAEMRAAG